VLAERTGEMSHKFTIDEMLTILVNIAHSLSSEAGKLFDIASVEFITRLTLEYNPNEQNLFVQVEDLIKIMTTLHSFNKLDSELKEAIFEHIET
jgi:hypothetical protein